MNKNKGILQKTVLLVAASMLLSSCATMFSGSSQTINVQAIDADTQATVYSAHCTLTNSKDFVYAVDGNPGSAIVSREYGGLVAKCAAPGYRQSGVGTGDSFNGWTLVNVLFWPGFIVDAASGAAKKYPSHITVLMTKLK